MFNYGECLDYLLTIGATGADVEDRPTVSEAVKVRVTMLFCVFLSGRVL
jgi:hypothetical protein